MHAGTGSKNPIAVFRKCLFGTVSGYVYWTWLIDRPPACTARDLRNSLLGDRRDYAH